jgi:dsRNA-specific ribonuclease|uniref:RNase III domain-containing protein n=1 Tax=viral metagenome TaxID=1070528 RepID=A0A6C0AJZ0_9ZZZZ
MEIAMSEKVLLQDGDINKDHDELIFDPFNERNKEISIHQVQNILKMYGVPDKVHNIKLYKRAFVHKSYVKRPVLENEANEVIIVDRPDNCLTLKTKSNERLEFLGDGILECITKYYLYRRFPKEDEGFMTEKKIALVKNESIGRMAYEMGLNNWYVISKNAEEKKTRTNLKKLGCLFEAFLGALFLDFNKIEIKDEKDWFKNVFVTGPGFQIAQIFVESIFDKHVNWMELLEKNDNYKNLLQVMLQKAFQVTPIYKEISQADDDDGYHMGVYLCVNKESYEFAHRDTIKMKVKEQYNHYVNLWKQAEESRDSISFVLFLGEAKHKIKKKAEQEACRLALINLK